MTEYKKPDVEIFRGKKDGSVIIVFGAIHGNEICGTVAIKKIINEIKSGRTVLKKGTVIFVPICNPLSYKKNKRFVEENLNRVFKKWKNPDSYEKRIASFLTKLVDRGDILLDIHSMESETAPIVFLDSLNKKELNLAEIIGAKYCLMGWPKMYKGDKNGIISYDTMAYAKKKKKECLTIECGQHKATASKEFAYNAILNILKYFGFINGKPKINKLISIYMRDFYIKKSKKDIFYKPWKNFDRFKRGEILAIKENGEKIIAKFNGMIVMPNKNAEIDTEWFYVGIDKKIPKSATRGQDVSQGNIL